eukprot:5319413-Prymnesium_polylepis.1
MYNYSTPWAPTVCIPRCDIVCRSGTRSPGGRCPRSCGSCGRCGCSARAGPPLAARRAAGSVKTLVP